MNGSNAIISKVQGENILTQILLMAWFLHAHIAPITPLVSGVQDGGDPNHPTEIYYGGSSYDSAEKMLEGLGVIVYPTDKFKVFPDPSLGVGSRLEIQRALPVTVNDAGHLATYRTWQPDIAGLLAENGISLLGQDSSDPVVTTPLMPDMTIKITRVAEIDVTETEKVNFKTIKQYDNTLEKGHIKITQKGVPGERANVITIKRIDGVEVSRTLKSSTVTIVPQNQIETVGTKVLTYGTGKASWYNRNATMVAASNTIPKGTLVKVISLASGKSVIVEIDDTGIRTDAIIDLSDDAFAALAPLGAGIINVRLEKYYPPGS